MRGRGPLRAPAAILLALATSSCGLGAGVTQGCVPSMEPTPLPGPLDESSGAALSRFHPDLFWTHNDGGTGTSIYAVGVDGSPRGVIRISNAPNRDWEDIELAPCSEGSCLFIGDVGDNYRRWDEALVHRLAEPSLSDTVAQVTTLRARFPEGPRDAEAIFVLPGERIHLVTKGSDGPVEIYRIPGAASGPADSDSVAAMERVQVLDAGRRVLPRQITGASASPSGDQVVIRSYETLEFYRVVGDTLVLDPRQTVNLRTLGESQGEGVGWGTGGRIVLTSEQGPFGAGGSFTLLRCEELR